MAHNVGNMKRLPYNYVSKYDAVSGNCFILHCYSQLIINQNGNFISITKI